MTPFGKAKVPIEGKRCIPVAARSSFVYELMRAAVRGGAWCGCISNKTPSSNLFCNNKLLSRRRLTYRVGQSQTNITRMDIGRLAERSTVGHYLLRVSPTYSRYLQISRLTAEGTPSTINRIKDELTVSVSRLRGKEVSGTDRFWKRLEPKTRPPSVNDRR